MSGLTEVSKKSNRQQEENIRSAELDFMLDLESRRLQTRGKETNLPLENNKGRRPHYRPKKSTLCRTKCTTLRPPRNQQTVQRRNNLLVAKHES